MDEDSEMRMLAHDRPRRPCVVEVNVRQHQVAHVIPANAVLLQGLLERGEARRRARVNDGHTTRALDDRRCDDVGSPKKLEVDPRKTMTQCIHGNCVRQIQGLY